MGFWDNIKSWFVVDIPAPVPTPEPQRATLPKHITDEWFSGLSSSKSGVAVTPNNSLAITAFWRAINILSGVIASLPFDVYEVTDDSAIKRRTHPLSRVLRRSPSQLYTKFDFFQTLILHLFTYGNFYAQIRRNNLGQVRSLEILDPNKVKVDTNARGEVVYEVDNASGKVRIMWYNVLHVSGLSWTGLQGMNIVEEFKDVLGTAIANQDYLANFYGNGATLSGVVSVPQKLDSESYTRLRNSWNNSYSGTHNAGATAILEQGASYQKVGLSPQEAGSDTAKKMSISDVARITGVPQFLLEDLDRATFNNIEHLGQLFVTYTILPLCRNLEAELSRKLLTEDEQDTHEIRADLHILLRADTENRAKLIESMMKWGIINRDEARSIEGLNPIADGSGQAYYIPMNMIDPTKEEPGEDEAANNISDEERQAQ
jgi:HK97 family phage portal protein